MRALRKRVVWAMLATGLVTLLVLAAMPSPPVVEVAPARRGPLQVTIDEEGETRARDRFVIAAPVAGRLERLNLEDGDPVKLGQILAVIHPLPLDVRSRAEAAARLESAKAAVREAAVRVKHAEADYQQTYRDLKRAQKLLQGGIISAQAFEQAKNAEVTSGHEVEAVRFRSRAAAYEVEVARAALIAAGAGRADSPRPVELRSPVQGRVLRIMERSERVVPAGAPLISVGDSGRIEVVVDVLSTDAVRVSPGMPVLLENWGGDQALHARVRLVEPAGFTKVSALGIEEKRVNVIADFVDPPGRLGDEYRVEARIVIWEAPDVLKIPSSVLFRRGQGWSVFAVSGGRARVRDVEVGHRNPMEAEVLSGLEAGSEVVANPSNDLADGVRVKVR